LPNAAASAAGALAAAYKQRHLANRNEMRVPGSTTATNVDAVLAITVIGYPLGTPNFSDLCRPAFIGPGNGSLSAAKVVLLVVVSTKAFSFYNRSSSNFAYALVTILCRIASCRIFKLSPN